LTEIFILLSIAAAAFLAFGFYFVINVRKYIGKLPTWLILSENSVWMIWNGIILYVVAFPAQPMRPLEAIGILLIFILPAYAGFCNFAWQYLLWRSLKRK
jgi:hypothetical protein